MHRHSIEVNGIYVTFCLHGSRQKKNTNCSIEGRENKIIALKWFLLHIVNVESSIYNVI